MNDRFSADVLPRWPISALVAGRNPVDLAHVRPFRIGGAEVRPASRELVGAGHREMLEPRVMQVLVALAAARGEILSRDDLIAACWDGRAVSDDAINRVISRLRTLARTFGAFQIETVIKVGYRLIEDGADGALAKRTKGGSGTITRRSVVIGGAVGVIGAGALLWQQPWRHRPPPEAMRLFELGEVAQRQGYPDQVRQTLSYYQRAVDIDPDFADAWGALALAHTHLLEGLSDAEIAGVPDRLRSAARHALELNADNADAHVALALIRPAFRNWAAMEAELQRLRARFANHWLLLARLAVLRFDVGRLNDGLLILHRALETDPMLPVGHAFAANALHNAERLQEAELVLDRAQERWPAHPWLWSARYRYLLFSGRPESAAAFVLDPEVRPSGFGPDEVGPRLRLARASETRAPADVAASAEDLRRAAVADPTTIPFAAAAFALLRRDELVFASLERYFFNRGSFGSPAPIGAMTRRHTRDLFAPPLARLRSDPRFADLLRRIGLESYWQSTGTRPDFRRQKGG